MDPQHELSSGIIAQKDGRYDQAYMHFDNCLRVLSSQLNANPDTIATVKNNLGTVCLSLGSNERALSLFAEALDLKIQRLGANNISVASSKANIAHVLQKLNRHDEAIGLSREVVDMFTKYYGQEHPNVIMATRSLGNSYFTQGKFDLAYATYDHARSIQTSQIASLNARLIQMGTNVDVYATNPSQSKQEAYQTLQSQIQALQISLAESKIHMSEILIQQQKGEYALQMLDEVLEILERSGGSASDKAVILDRKAAVYEMLGRKDQADNLRRVAVQTFPNSTSMLVT